MWITMIVIMMTSRVCLVEVDGKPPFVLPFDSTSGTPNRGSKSPIWKAGRVSTSSLPSSSVSTSHSGGSGDITSKTSTDTSAGRTSPDSRSTTTSTTTTNPIRVCYQGEPGAYSEKSLRELLGPNVIAVGRPNFESCYRAVANNECDYACLPVENSLGGSIHENYDLMLRYDLTIVAEHECRVSHCLHALPGVKREDIKYAMSHPQALAQCDNYLRGLGITPVPMYDTAGSAKLLADHEAHKKKLKSKNNDNNVGDDDDDAKNERALPDQCTASNTAAVASDLAGRTYKLNCLDRGIEDDDTNFTRFLLLGRKSVSRHLTKHIPSKTSIVFTLPNTPGALYKALACFSLRDIDFSKIESRPTSASLLNYLKFKNARNGRSTNDLPRFRYCFYLDFLASELDPNAQNALHHLKEQSEFCRILGCYPQKSKLVGEVHDAVEGLKHITTRREDVTLLTLPSDKNTHCTLNIGILGYGAFGQFLGRKFAQDNHNVRCIDPLDKANVAKITNVQFYPMFELDSFLKDLDVLVIAVPLVDFENVVSSLPAYSLNDKLVVEVCPLSVHPKQVLLQNTNPTVDIISSNPLFGPSNSDDATSWDNRPMIYEKVRISNQKRAEDFLHIFEKARCQMVQMTAEQQDAHTADAEFVTHLTGRLLDQKMLPPTPVTSREYAALCDVADMTSGDTFDLFYGMYKFNSRAKEHLNKLRNNLAKIERQLAAKEAYLAASADLRNRDRQRLIAECKDLLREVVSTSNIAKVEIDDDHDIADPNYKEMQTTDAKP